MSAPAVKSSMPGVGTSSGAPSHSIIPMNATTQKVSGSESTSVKTMTGGGLNFVTLQSNNAQPLSLVQDHRPPLYQNTSYTGPSTNEAKESEVEKTIPNGIEVTKVESEQETRPVSKQTDSSRNNNVSPENPEEKPQEPTPTESNPSAPSESPVPSEQVPSKPEEKKVTPPNTGNTNSTNNNTSNNNSTNNSTGNSTKESDGNAAAPVHSQPKSSPHKTEDNNQTKTEAVSKTKPAVQSCKVTSESTPAQTAPLNHPKAESKSTNVVPKATKRKSKDLKDMKGIAGNVDGASKPKRNRIQTQPYQSPLPEIALLVKSLNKLPTTKAPDDKLIVFYKNEFLAVRNAEGSFFVCQAMQNIYKSSRRIRIRWLSQDKNNGEIYSPDFYDYIDFDCILTNLNLNKTDKNKFQLTKIELLRTENILKRAIDVEAGVSEKPSVTEEHPDGLDLSLYKDESQLKKRRKNAVNKQKQARKKAAQKLSQSSGEGESTPAQGDKKMMTKAKSTKKPPVNKALALAKSVAKGPNRAERAMNRNKPSTTVDETTTVTPTSNNSNTSIAANAVNATKTNNNTTTITTSTNDSNKKIDVKKIVKQQQQPSNNNTSGVTKTKIRGSNPSPSQSSESASPPASNPAGRSKRQVIGQTGVAPIPDEPTARKKPRGRA